MGGVQKGLRHAAHLGAVDAPVARPGPVEQAVVLRLVLVGDVDALVAVGARDLLVREVAA